MQIELAPKMTNQLGSEPERKMDSFIFPYPKIKQFNKILQTTNYISISKELILIVLIILFLKP